MILTLLDNESTRPEPRADANASHASRQHEASCNAALGPCGSAMLVTEAIARSSPGLGASARPRCTRGCRPRGDYAAAPAACLSAAPARPFVCSWTTRTWMSPVYKCLGQNPAIQAKLPAGSTCSGSLTMSTQRSRPTGKRRSEVAPGQELVPRRHQFMPGQWQRGG